MLDGFRTSPERENLATMTACAWHNIAKDRTQPDVFADEELVNDVDTDEPDTQYKGRRQTSANAFKTEGSSDATSSGPSLTTKIG